MPKEKLKTKYWEDFLEQLINNAKLPKLSTQHKFLDNRRFRFDGAFIKQKVAYEVMGGIWIGGRHTTGVGFSRDCEKLNLAVADGWKVLYFTTEMIQDMRAINWLRELL